MRIEDQCVSLELARRLKELNLKQNSLFNWHDIDSFYPCVRHEDYIPERSGDFILSAFSVAELGEILPRLLHKNGVGYFLEIFKDVDENWHIKYEGYIDNKLIQIYSLNEANARAKMLIHIIENNLVTEEWRKQWLI